MVYKLIKIGLNFGQNRTKTQPKICQKSAKIGRNLDQNWTKTGQKLNYIWTKTKPKLEKNWTKESAKVNKPKGKPPLDSFFFFNLYCFSGRGFGRSAEVASAVQSLRISQVNPVLLQCLLLLSFSKRPLLCNQRKRDNQSLSN